MENYEFSNLCGAVYSRGNVIFTPDGNSVLTPVGNRVCCFDLVNNRSKTLPTQNIKNVSKIALSFDGNVLVTVDTDGRALLISYRKNVVISRFNFRKKVTAMEFSPTDRLLAVTHGAEVRVWEPPSLKQDLSVAVMTLRHSIFAHRAKISAISWSKSSQFLATCSSDSTARVTCLGSNKSILLTGHKGSLIHCFFSETNFYTLSKSGVLFNWKIDLKHLRSQEKITLKEKSEVDGAQSDKLKRVEVVSKHFYETKRNKIVSAFSRALQGTDKFILLTGFSNGVFLIHELPSFTVLQSFSVTNEKLDSVALSPSGDWAAIASKRLGQLLVWEWQSESAILKQQGHSTEVESVAFSPDGRLFVTGGSDGRVKVWNSENGFCFATFDAHSAPVTKVCFAPSGAAVLSSSKDGTVKAFDLVKYKNFRVLLVEGKNMQFTCVDVDPSGKLICAGSFESDLIVWELRSGKVVEQLKGHNGPVSDVSFDKNSGMLASCSWDGTAKLWNLFSSKEKTESFNLGSDALALAFRPDGRILSVSSVQGLLQFWDILEGELKLSIDITNHIMGGKRKADPRSAKNSTVGRTFTSLCFSPDGEKLLAGGDSKFVCLYHPASGSLLHKFQISENRSLDGVMDFLRKKDERPYYGGKSRPDSDSEWSPSDTENIQPDKSLPGVLSGTSKRNTLKAAMSKSVTFSPTGRKWACVTSEGVLLYTLAADRSFNPFELEEGVDPSKIREALQNKKFSLAMAMSLKLGEEKSFVEALETTPPGEIPLVVSSLNKRYILRFLQLLVSPLRETKRVHFYVLWLKAVMSQRRSETCAAKGEMLSALRGLYKELNDRTDVLMKLKDLNMAYMSSFVSDKKRKKLGVVSRKDEEMKNDWKERKSSPFEHFEQNLNKNE